MSELNIIATRRNAKLEEKLPVYGLVYDSYIGGLKYIKSDHLFRYVKEADKQFTKRKDRSVYFNYVQPILDILTGFIFAEEPTREYGEFDNVKLEVSPGKDIKSFMHSLAIQSGLYPTGILIDTPNFDPELIKTKADELRYNINPYACIYSPSKIRDFNFDKSNNLEWVLLDDSYIDSADPFKKASVEKIYTLWTRSGFQKFKVRDTDNKIGDNEPKVILLEESQHGLGYVPFRFVNWKDPNNTHIVDSPFETVSLLARQIYNSLSYLDEMLAQGTFKHLFYPAKSKQQLMDMAPEFVTGGFVDDIVTVYNSENGTPMYLGAGLGDIAPFNIALEMYEKRIYGLFGMNEDRDKTYIQSGYAKSLEFTKSEALLRAASRNLEATEKWVVETIAHRKGKLNYTVPKVEYYRNFQQENIDNEIARLSQLTMSPYRTLNQEAWRQIASLVLNDNTSKETKLKIEEEIQSEAEEEPSENNDVKEESQIDQES